MFDPERLLGQLLTKGIRHGARKRGLSLGTKATLGMGAIGVAMAAYDHFTKDSTNSPTTTPPPPPTPSSPNRSTATPPPPPPPLPSAAAISPNDSQAVATLLIRAMIAAANADGNVDEEEAAKILDSAAQDGMDDEERAFLVRELDQPQSIEQIASAAGKNEELCQQVYVASLAAVDIDTDVEREYLQQLASRLALSTEQVESLHTGLA